MILRHAFEPPDNARLAHLCGSLDEHLRAIEQALDVRIGRRNEAFRIDAPSKAGAERALRLLQTLYERARRPLGLGATIGVFAHQYADVLAAAAFQ